MKDKLLTPSDVASALSIKTGTLATWRVRGVGPNYIRLNGTGAIRYIEADLLEYTKKLKSNG